VLEMLEKQTKYENIISIWDEPIEKVQPKMK
jgi:hypothetical protein